MQPRFSNLPKPSYTGTGPRPQRNVSIANSSQRIWLPDKGDSKASNSRTEKKPHTEPFFHFLKVYCETEDSLSFPIPSCEWMRQDICQDTLPFACKSERRTQADKRHPFRRGPEASKTSLLGPLPVQGSWTPGGPQPIPAAPAGSSRGRNLSVGGAGRKELKQSWHQRWGVRGQGLGHSRGRDALPQMQEGGR